MSIPNALPLLFLCSLAAFGADPIELRIKADQITGHVNPKLYGLMTEEINFSYDGGLYGELIRNRSFKEDVKDPVFWKLVEGDGGKGSMALDPATPLNDAIGTSLKLTIAEAAGKQSVGVANEGFWGIPVRPGTKYQASFFAKAAAGFAGPLTVALVSADGAVTQAAAQVAHVTGEWKKYDVTLTAGAKAAAAAENRLVISANKPGTLWLSTVSLFPPTYANRANGNRKDLMELMAGIRPGFLRFPGGNYLEGNTIETRFDWKKTLGPVSARPGHMNDAWKYWSSDGMGLLDFLHWCEDLHMDPVLAVYAGYSLRQVRVAAGPDLEPYVKEALEEIEYVMGAASTTWGARRAKDGHAAPFKLEYVEVGNEDQFDRQAGSYDARFTQFFDAIRAKYPQLKIIATAATKTRTPDVIDEHYYRRSEDEMASHSHDYDKRPRDGSPKIFVGEWATRVGAPTPNMSAALGDSAWMAGMERNSDIVIMECYAPLFVNVNKGAMQWPTDLIGYDAMSSYGSPAYYAQAMFSSNHGDLVVGMEERGVPERTWQPPPGRGRGPNGQPITPPPPPPPPQQVPLLFFDATKDSKTGAIYVKVVNRAGTAQDVKVSVSGVSSVEAKGQAVTMSASSPDDTNTVTEPKKIVPVTAAVEGLGKEFTRSFPPYSITVLTMKGH